MQWIIQYLQKWSKEGQAVTWQRGHGTEGLLPTAVALFRRVMCSATLQKHVQEQFEEHEKVFKVLIWTPNSSDLNPVKRLCLDGTFTM